MCYFFSVKGYYFKMIINAFEDIFLHILMHLLQIYI